VAVAATARHLGDHADVLIGDPELDLDAARVLLTAKQYDLPSISVAGWLCKPMPALGMSGDEGVRNFYRGSRNRPGPGVRADRARVCALGHTERPGW
jgi:hypothetical protein